MGRAAVFDVPVTSLLDTLTSMEAKERKLGANDAKCHELGWL